MVEPNRNVPPSVPESSSKVIEDLASFKVKNYNPLFSRLTDNTDSVLQ